MSSNASRAKLLAREKNERGGKEMASKKKRRKKKGRIRLSHHPSLSIFSRITLVLRMATFAFLYRLFYGTVLHLSNGELIPPYMTFSGDQLPVLSLSHWDQSFLFCRTHDSCATRQRKDS